MLCEKKFNVNKWIFEGKWGEIHITHCLLAPIRIHCWNRACNRFQERCHCLVDTLQLPKSRKLCLARLRPKVKQVWLCRGGLESTLLCLDSTSSIRSVECWSLFSVAQKLFYRVVEACGYSGVEMRPPSRWGHRTVLLGPASEWSKRPVKIGSPNVSLM